ncbi:MAG: histidine phosphatase family protein [Pseudomonadota bacterium]
MKLILLRHAKSDWGDPFQDDRDRPLNARGHAAAPRIGAWLRAGDHVPDRVLCSAARRTRETLAGLGLPDAAVEVRDDLYLAPADRILSLAQGHGTLLIVAHNPGIGTAACRAVTDRPDHPKFGAYPTGACTVIDAANGLPGPCLAFSVPRDLT